MGAAVADEAARQGVLVRAVGDTICLSPPLISTATEIAEITDRFRTAYEEVLARYCTSRGADALAPLRRRRNDCSCPSTS